MIQKNKKVKDALIGYIKKSKLEYFDPAIANNPGEFSATFLFYESENGPEQLFTHKLSTERVLNQLELAYPNRIDRRFSGKLLTDQLDKWILLDDNHKTSKTRQALSTEFMNEGEESIKEREVYVPVSGILFGSTFSITLGNCRLVANKTMKGGIKKYIQIFQKINILKITQI